MKYEWRKSEKELYLPKKVPTLIQVPKLKYFTITGKGNPNNNPDFQARIQILYKLSYAIRMMLKKGFTPDGYMEYTVYPLEGIWENTDVNQSSKVLNKDCFVYKLMVRQPEFVTEEVVNKAFEIVRDKEKNNLLIDEVKFEEIEDGLCVQMLHVGSYDKEQETTIKDIEEYIKENNYKRTLSSHKEIYLKFSDNEEELLTVIRVFIIKK